MFMTKRGNLMGNQTRAWFLFVTPAFIVILTLSLYPLLYTFFLSVHRYNIASGMPKRFNGLANFISIIGNERFLNSIKITFIYVIIGVASTMILGVALALLLNDSGMIMRVLRGVALLPMLICGVALVLAWQLLYNSDFGLFNMILEAAGLPARNWLGDPKITLYAMALTDIWQCTPFVMILTLAGIQSISEEYYEAAAIDGANRVQVLFHITLPLLKNVLLTVLIIRMIDCFKTFEKPRLLTNNGGPAGTTELISLYVYKQSFESWEYGIGAMGAVVIAALIAILTVFIIKLSRLNIKTE
jgi:multiple sugar transport system permease protein